MMSRHMSCFLLHIMSRCLFVQSNYHQTFFFRSNICGDIVIQIDTVNNSTSKYQGTLGHKVNHDFRPNSEFVHVETPRYLMILHFLLNHNINNIFSN